MFSSHVKRLLVCWSLFILIIIAAPGISSSQEIEQGKTGQSPPPPSQMVIYYFHGYFSCFTCQKMEEYSRETLQEHFKEELASGTIVFQPVNVDAPENQHFLSDYRIGSRTVVLTLRKAGQEVRHRDLSNIMSFVRDHDGFIKYLFGEIESFMREM